MTCERRDPGRDRRGRLQRPVPRRGRDSGQPGRRHPHARRAARAADPCARPDDQRRRVHHSTPTCRRSTSRAPIRRLPALPRAVRADRRRPPPRGDGRRPARPAWATRTSLPSARTRSRPGSCSAPGPRPPTRSTTRPATGSPGTVARTFVERVDFVTGVGTDRARAAGPSAARFHRLHRVVTNLGVFDFSGPGQHGRSCHCTPASASPSCRTPPASPLHVAGPIPRHPPPGRALSCSSSARSSTPAKRREDEVPA